MKITRVVLWAALISYTGIFAAEIPVIQEVDVVIAGGSSAAVAAAVAAKEAGARVFLAAPRPYLGEDLAGELRVVRDPDDETSSPLFRAIFDPSLAPAASWAFTYTSDLAPDVKLHADPERTKLNDGKRGNSASDSVQYNGNVTLTLDLGAVREIAGAEVDSYARRPGRGKKLSSVGFLTSAVAVSTSTDGVSWTDPVESSDPIVIGTDQAGFTLRFPASCRYVRLTVTKDPSCSRQLLSEVRVLKPAARDGVFAPRTTPLVLKRALDAALLKAAVPYLTGALPCAVLKDADGRLAGIVLSDRSGRQAIRAKVVIDATSRGRIAEAAGAARAPFPAGVYTFTRTILSGEAPQDERVTAETIPGDVPVTARNHLVKNRTSSIKAQFRRCAVRIPMKDGGPRAFAEAEQVARDATFVPTQVDAADTLSFVSPDRFFGTKPFTGAWKKASACPLDAFRPKGFDNLFVLSALADLPPEAAKKLVRPGSFLLTGTRIGAAAAEVARAVRSPGRVQTLGSIGTTGGKTLASDRIREHAKALPAYLVKATGHVSDTSALPVLAACDTLVIGAGTGGAPAGIAAARQGAKTIVCEYLYTMGGVQTDGLIGYYYYGNVVGFTKEIDEGARTTGAVFPQSKSEWYRRENRKAGAEILFGALASGVVIEGDRVTGVAVTTADGTRGVILCKNAIDATGNAELPAMAGTDTEFITDTELSVQGVGQASKTLGVAYANSDIGFVDDTDAADLFYFALRSRMSLPENAWDQAQVVNSRERRRMIGAFYMTPPDVINGRTYPDTIVRTYSNFDSHGQTVHDTFFIEDPGHKPMYVNLPYRCLLPKTLEGLLVTGLGISAHRDAMPILRMQPDVQNQGYAAGVAAAMAVKAGVNVRKIDVKALQHHLVDAGVLPPNAIGTKDSFPLSDDAFAAAVRTLPEGYKGLGVLMTDTARAVPLLQHAYQVAEGGDRFVYAHTLAMLGQPDGEKMLIAKLSAMNWDKGWNYRGMGQFNRSVSWVDSYAIALGHCKSKAAVAALTAKADALTQACEYSHFRAVARALEEIGDKTAAPALARVLQREGIGGHWQKMQADVPIVPGYRNESGDMERTLSLREICIARALFRLGDTPEGLGRRTLEAYAADPRRAFAGHAQKVLDGRTH